ncbi:MAG: amino acid/amide transporter substrate-binding protein family [Ilumatobacteraceae bacterium]|nr:amino acid/amide transporter substrate-binding protein family [Ilumatobacteraceae bacterium]
MSAARRRRWQPVVTARVSAVVVACLLLADCGTRLDHSAFTEAPAGAPAAAATPSSATGGPASDPGISASTITLGLVVSKTSPLGAETFSGPMYGAQAYVADLNAHGGIAGRQVKLIVCDDGATGAGNTRCVHQLIDDDKVFAFVGNAIYDYAGASYVDQQGVPDVAGQPIGNSYDQYGHLWSIYGTQSPRDGTVGWNGQLSGGTEVYRYFAKTLGAKTAAVVSYNQADSQRFADLTAKALGVEGYDVVREQLDFAVPNWDAAAIDMKSRGVDIVFDALDSAGNVSLCKAMDAAHLTVKAKVVTVQSWTELVRSDYKASPTCRNELYATATTRNYMDTSNPAVAEFRADMKTTFPTREDKLSMWELEGWAGARWFADAMTSCGDGITRSCVEDYLRRPDGYDGHGVFVTRSFVVTPQLPTTLHDCLFVAHWSDDAYDGAGGWQSSTPDGNDVCYDVPSVAYTP